MHYQQFNCTVNKKTFGEFFIEVHELLVKLNLQKGYKKEEGHGNLDLIHKTEERK